MITPRNNLAAAALGGAVYALGGVKTTDEDPGGVVVDAAEDFSPIRKNFPIGKAEWTAIPKLPHRRVGAGAAGLHDRVYVAGGARVEEGATEETFTKSVIAFDPNSPEAGWQDVDSLQDPRGFLRLIAVGKHLYAIGGMNEAGDNVTTVERYDPIANEWETVASMNQERGLPGVAALRVGSKPLIVVVGGAHIVGGDFDNPTLRDSTEVYDVAENVWRPHPALLPQGRASLVSAAASGDNVLAIGGFLADKSLDTDDVRALKIKLEDLQ